MSTRAAGLGCAETAGDPPALTYEASTGRVSGLYTRPVMRSDSLNPASANLQSLRSAIHSMRELQELLAVLVKDKRGEWTCERLGERIAQAQEALNKMELEMSVSK